VYSKRKHRKGRGNDKTAEWCINVIPVEDLQQSRSHQAVREASRGSITYSVTSDPTEVPEETLEKGPLNIFSLF